MATILSPIPRAIFTILEPVSLVGGFLLPILDPTSFIADQVPNNPIQPLTANSHILALQLGNVYGLLCLIGLAVLWTTTEPKVVRNYIIALWLADFSHIGVSAYFMGSEALLDVGSWNAMAWGNIGFTSFLCLSRTAWLMGLFGPDNEPRRLRRGLPNQRKNA